MHAGKCVPKQYTASTYHTTVKPLSIVSERTAEKNDKHGKGLLQESIKCVRNTSEQK